MDFDNKKWKEYKEPIQVALKEPRRVARVGYEIHRGLARFYFLKEMDDRIAFDPEDEDPGVEPSLIVGNHPRMAPYLSIRDNLREALGDTLRERGVCVVEPHRAIDKMMEKFDRSVIRELVEQTFNALKAKEKKPPKREIHFGALNRPWADDDKDWWRGPWMVTGQRTVYTGTYDEGVDYRNYFGESEYEPPSLRNRKAHVLLRSHTKRSVCATLLKEDTYPWECEKTSRILLEEA